jgi:hypothetical protein
MMHTRPTIQEVPNPAYLAAVKRQKIAEKASGSYQPGQLGHKSDLPQQLSLAEQMRKP